MARRILIIDDHPMVANTIRAACAAHRPDLIVESASTIEMALRVARTKDDIALVLLDYQLPDSEGFSGFFRLEHELRSVPIVFLSAFDQPQVVGAARAVGARGFLSKCQSMIEIATGIGRALGGERVFPEDGEIDEHLRDAAEHVGLLSTGQKRVLSALVRGHLNKQIAIDLGLTEKTVKTHLTAIFRKLGVASRLDAVLAVKPLLDPAIH